MKLRKNFNIKSDKHTFRLKADREIKPGTTYVSFELYGQVALQERDQKYFMSALVHNLTRERYVIPLKL